MYYYCGLWDIWYIGSIREKLKNIGNFKSLSDMLWFGAKFGVFLYDHTFVILISSNHWRLQDSFGEKVCSFTLVLGCGLMSGCQMVQRCTSKTNVHICCQVFI